MISSVFATLFFPVQVTSKSSDPLSAHYFFSSVTSPDSPVSDEPEPELSAAASFSVFSLPELPAAGSVSDDVSFEAGSPAPLVSDAASGASPESLSELVSASGDTDGSTDAGSVDSSAVPGFSASAPVPAAGSPG